MSEQIRKQVPTGIRVTAWMWIISAALVGAGEVLGALVESMVQQLAGPGAGVPPELAGLVASAAKFGVEDVLQIAAAVVGLWAGFALLRLEAWARTAIEVLTWLTLAYTLERGIFWTVAWKTVSGEVAQDAGIPVDQNVLQSAGTATGIVLTIVFAVPLVLMIRYLRGAEARAATAPGPRK